MNTQTETSPVQVREVKEMAVLGTVSRQWASRPDDQRFVDMATLRASVLDRRNRSRELPGAALERFDVRAADKDADGMEQEVVVFNKDKGGSGARLTHASFGQLCSRAQVPAAYLRKLPAPLAALNLSYSLSKAERQDAKLLITRDDLAGSETPTQARCITSPSYGRIWDIEVVDAVMRNCGPEWKVPSASYAAKDPKRATTLYASDRDVFVFLVDDSHPIEVPGEPGHELFRGFYVSNSETMHGSLVLASFLYDHVCDNRNVWGVRDFKELRIRHTAGAPDRFLREARPALTRYLESGTQSTVEMIRRAQDLTLGDNVKAVKAKLAGMKFTQTQVAEALDYAETRPGNPLSLWNVEQGLTAVARDIANADDRTDLETRAGKLMDMVA